MTDTRTNVNGGIFFVDYSNKISDTYYHVDDDGDDENGGNN